MQQDILIIGVLFPAIPLMMINFGNRYSVLATLIRNLHDNVIRDNTTPNDASRFLRQIASLRCCTTIRTIRPVPTGSMVLACSPLGR